MALCCAIGSRPDARVGRPYASSHQTYGLRPPWPVRHCQGQWPRTRPPARPGCTASPRTVIEPIRPSRPWQPAPALQGALRAQLNLAVLFDTRTSEDYLVMERAPRASGWAGEPTERSSALTSTSGSTSAYARSVGGLRSTWPGCLVSCRRELRRLGRDRLASLGRGMRAGVPSVDRWDCQLKRRWDPSVTAHRQTR